MRTVVLCCAALLALPAEAGTESPIWSGYLDYAYVYSSADAATLKGRLAEYGDEAGVSLERYIEDYIETLAPLESKAESATRRKAIAYVPFKWSLIMSVVRFIPSFVFRRLNF